MTSYGGANINPKVIRDTSPPPRFCVGGEAAKRTNAHEVGEGEVAAR